MASIVQTYFNIYFTEIIVAVLVLSIIIVLISILYVLFSKRDDVINQKPKITNIKNKKKMKYTKQFLKGVDGIDLDLKINHKKTS